MLQIRYERSTRYRCLGLCDLACLVWLLSVQVDTLAVMWWQGQLPQTVYLFICAH